MKFIIDAISAYMFIIPKKHKTWIIKKAKNFDKTKKIIENVLKCEINIE